MCGKQDRRLLSSVSLRNLTLKNDISLQSVCSPHLADIEEKNHKYYLTNCLINRLRIRSQTVVILAQSQICDYPTLFLDKFDNFHTYMSHFTGCGFDSNLMVLAMSWPTHTQNHKSAIYPTLFLTSEMNT